MWNRLVYMGILLLMATVAVAAPTIPSPFTPVPNDLSMWYLGSIFGSDLVPGQNVPNIQLLSRLFEIFNQVALSVGLIIVVYTIITGTLNTAAEGKAMGEKWNSLWIPFRIATGIGILIPKAGSGYCIAQYVIMWLTMQGIGAADAVWNTMLDYFEKGGTIYAATSKYEPKTAFTYDNMNYTYALQSTSGVGGGSYGSTKTQSVSLMRSAVCVDKMNQDPAREQDKQIFRIYTKQVTYKDNPSYLLIFGNDKNYQYDPSGDLAKIRGAECGVVRVAPTKTAQDQEQKMNMSQVNGVYGTALQKMSKSLADLTLTTQIAAGESDIRWGEYYFRVNTIMQTYIREIAQYETLIRQSTNTTVQSSDPFKLFKEYGWILAGNYYTLLSHRRGEQELQSTVSFILPENAYTAFEYLPPNAADKDDKEVASINAFYEAFKGHPAAMYTTQGGDSDWDRAMQEKLKKETGQSTTAATPLGEKQLESIAGSVDYLNSGSSNSATADRVKEYIGHLSGNQKGKGLGNQDPIFAAAKYGKHLTESAIGIMVAFGVTYTGMVTLASIFRCSGSAGYAVQAAGNLLIPMILALGAFMYAEGVVLGVFIPLIPYVTFLTGVVGWFLQVVESVAAAPLVAIGLVFPETKENIWGRAEPAFMLVLNLFLRPPLMIIGFAAAMIVTWVVIELLNIGFLILVEGTFQIENMFGFVTIMMAYTALFTYLVTETYSLINVLPNRVLHWIGDQAMGVKGAEEALGGAKQGAEAGGRAVAAGATMQKADTWRAAAHGEEIRKTREAEKQNKLGGG